MLEEVAPGIDIRRDILERGAGLGDDVGVRDAGDVIGFRLADADDGPDAPAQRRVDFAVHRLVGFAVTAAPFRVAEDRPGRAGIL